ncbi:MAG TPA: DUF3830 family protein [Thermoleophilaceae bacterium]|nr:DUF3830 family protein [Thermoleophilaceae bacterium]
MSREAVLEVPAYGAAVGVELLWDDAPRTCAAIWSALPIVKPAFHARRSGQELFLLADPFDNPGPENQRLEVAAGDVLFAHMPPSWTDDHEDYTRGELGLFDIALIYGPDALIRGPEAPVAGNLFGRVVEDLPALAEICTRMWLQGCENVTLRRA